MNRTRFILLLIICTFLAFIGGSEVWRLMNSPEGVTRTQAAATYVALDSTVAAMTVVAETIPTEAVVVVDGATPAPPPNEARLLEQAKAWELVHFDTYNGNAIGWRTGRPSDELLGDASIEDGRYVWDVTATDSLVHSTTPIDAPDSNFYVSVEMRKEDTTVGGQNVVFRHQDNDNYFDFGLCEDNASYRMWKLQSDDWYELVECTPSTAIKVNDFNTLAVIGLGDQFTLFINDQFVQTFQDNTHSRGTTGVSVELDQGQSNLFEFDNFELRVPPEE